GWYSAVGALNQYIHVWAYKDAGERERIRAEAMKVPGWPPETKELMLKQENALMIPAACSPLH
ncbi:MAG: NIPSNAP family protein, partial [Candidatus Binatia bacterium]